MADLRRITAMRQGIGVGSLDTQRQASAPDRQLRNDRRARRIGNYATTGERAGSATVAHDLTQCWLPQKDSPAAFLGAWRGLLRRGASPSRNAHRAIAQRRRITMITLGRAARLCGRVDQIKSGRLSASRRDDHG
jgi:hypothetical protein